MTAATLTPDIKQATAKAPPAPAPVPARSSSPMPPHLAAAPPALSLSGGEPLAPSLRQRLETSYDADLGAIRVHTDPASSRAADGLGTKAFAFGPHIVLGAGARADNLGLMAHEAAHTVQQRGAPVIQHYGGPSDAHETEARRASEAVLNGQRFAIQGRTDGERPQGIWGIDLPNPLDWLADKANVIPGFRMFTIILGVNPINMSAVPRSAANILRALIEIMPGGGLITQALDNSGVFEKVGAWVEQQIATLGMVGSAFKAAIDAFIKSTNPADVLTDPGGVWARAKRIFTDPIDRIKNFAVGLVDGIVQFVKDAILQPLAALASKTRAWDLLIAVLGKNPITGEAVPRTADTLIGGFMKLIGQEEVWSRIKSTGAIGRCWTWFQSTMNTLLGFVQQIPTLAVNAFKSLELFDIVLVPRAFVKVGAVFANFVGSFISWAGDAVWKLLEIVFDVVSPGAWGYIKKTGAALKGILKNPLPFIGNLVKAAKLGFQNFAGNFGGHLKAGLIDWLTGSLPGVYIPKAFSLAEVGKFALSILGITWAQIRAKIVKVLGPNGEKIMAGLETTFDVVVALVRGGPAAAWAVIQEKLSDLKDTVIGGITDFVVDTVVKKAIPKLIGMFIPGAGFISAIISIYDTVMVFVNKIAKIIQVVTAFIDSIVAIAGGAIGAAAARVEGILAGLLSLAINFLAGFAGLGKVADKVMGVINKVRAKVDQAIDKAIAWIVAKAKALFGKLFGKKDEKDKAGGPQKPGNIRRPRVVVPFALGAGSHELILDPKGGVEPQVEMASGTPTPIATRHRDAYNGIEHFKHYMTTITDAQVKQEFEAKLRPAILKFQTVNTEAWKHIYLEQFPEENSGIAPISPEEAEKRQEVVAVKAENMLMGLKKWGAETGIPDLSEKAVVETLETKGAKIWEEQWLKKKQHLEAVIAKVTYKGRPLGYRGSLSKGEKGIHKNLTRFNTDAFDVDLNVVHEEDFDAARKAGVGLTGSQIFPGDHPALAELNRVSAAAHKAVTEAFPDVEGIDDCFVTLRRVAKK